LVLMCRQMSYFSAWESIGSSIRRLNAKGRKARPRVVDGLRPFFFNLYFYSTKLGITTMPTIFRMDMIDGVWFSGIWWRRGA
jgi:hypothetical protein